MNKDSSDRLYLFLGRNIKEARQRKKKSQENLAKEIKLTRTSITNIEKGRQKISLDTLWHIASILEVTVTDLLPKPGDINLSLEAKLNGVSKDEKQWIKEVVG